MELGPKRPSLLWLLEANSIIVVYMDPLGFLLIRLPEKAVFKQRRKWCGKDRNGLRKGENCFQERRQWHSSNSAYSHTKGMKGAMMDVICPGVFLSLSNMSNTASKSLPLIDCTQFRMLLVLVDRAFFTCRISLSAMVGTNLKLMSSVATDVA